MGRTGDEVRESIRVQSDADRATLARIGAALVCNALAVLGAAGDASRFVEVDIDLTALERAAAAERV